MSLGWKILLPLAVGNLVFNTIIIALYDTFTR
jgi:NADH:ubiquinone oxidoreductase subunit H